RPCIERSNGPVSLSPFRSWPDCIINTSGYDFQKAQETLLYLARTRDCRSCAFKAQCCPKTPFRRIQRSLYAQARDVARAVAKPEAFERSCRDRNRVEMLFAHLRRIFRLSRLRLRGPCGAQFEFTLAAIAQTPRRLAKLVVRPPPIAQVCFA